MGDTAKLGDAGGTAAASHVPLGVEAELHSQYTPHSTPRNILARANAPEGPDNANIGITPSKANGHPPNAFIKTAEVTTKYGDDSFTLAGLWARLTRSPEAPHAPIKPIQPYQAISSGDLLSPVVGVKGAITAVGQAKQEISEHKLGPATTFAVAAIGLTALVPESRGLLGAEGMNGARLVEKEAAGEVLSAESKAAKGGGALERSAAERLTAQELARRETAQAERALIALQESAAATKHQIASALNIDADTLGSDLAAANRGQSRLRRAALAEQSPPKAAVHENAALTPPVDSIELGTTNVRPLWLPKINIIGKPQEVPTLATVGGAQPGASFTPFNGQWTKTVPLKQPVTLNIPEFESVPGFRPLKVESVTVGPNGENMYGQYARTPGGQIMLDGNNVPVYSSRLTLDHANNRIILNYGQEIERGLPALAGSDPVDGFALSVTGPNQVDLSLAPRAELNATRDSLVKVYDSEFGSGIVIKRYDDGSGLIRTSNHVVGARQIGDPVQLIAIDADHKQRAFVGTLVARSPSAGTDVAFIAYKRGPDFLKVPEANPIRDLDVTNRAPVTQVGFGLGLAEPTVNDGNIIAFRKLTPADLSSGPTHGLPPYDPNANYVISSVCTPVGCSGSRLVIRGKLADGQINLGGMDKSATLPEYAMPPLPSRF